MGRFIEGSDRAQATLLPDTIDDSLSYFISEWRQTHKYDPGRK